MEIEQFFYLGVAGNPKVHGSVEIFVRKVKRAVIRVDPDAKMDFKTFAQIRYNFEWRGKVKFIERVDDLYKNVIKAANEDLDKWEFKIRVGYHEKEKRV